jgi:hypothetical protein
MGGQLLLTALYLRKLFTCCFDLKKGLGSQDIKESNIGHLNTIFLDLRLYSYSGHIRSLKNKKGLKMTSFLNAFLRYLITILKFLLYILCDNKRCFKILILNFADVRRHIFTISIKPGAVLPVQVEGKTVAIPWALVRFRRVPIVEVPGCPITPCPRTLQEAHEVDI